MGRPSCDDGARACTVLAKLVDVGRVEAVCASPTGSRRSDRVAEVVSTAGLNMGGNCGSALLDEAGLSENLLFSFGEEAASG